MMGTWLLFLTTAGSILGYAIGLPTWPASVDELEDIMFLNTGYQARAFPADITPCNFSVNGPSRIASAEWLRTAFHDMAPANVLTGVGGLDASLQYELGGDGGENIGSAFNTTLLSFTPFFSSRASLADLIAMGVYASVRSCGGPIIPIRTGRIDATVAGSVGVPLPQNSQYTFIQQFARMGFNVSEMIILTACGHTIGGVHAINFPEVLESGSVSNDYQHFDSTTAFDEKVASEYINGNSSDPLAGPFAISNSYDSDIAVFTADNNATIELMADPAYFQLRCQVMLQRMIEVVPAGVSLTDAIVPYDVKPSNLQLTIQPGGTELQFTGQIRVRTTQLNGTISDVQLTYVDRNGVSCSSCVIGTQYAGTTNGFDESFVFYSFSSVLPSTTSISAFTVQVTASGSTVTYDNNGKGYPIQDTIMFQSPQSCIATSSDSNGNYEMTIIGAVRNTVTSASPTLSVEVKKPRSCCVVPALSTLNVTMAETATIGDYVLYTGSYALTSDQITTSKFSISIKDYSDSFKSTALTGSCSVLSGSVPIAYGYLGCYTDDVNSRTFTAATTSDNNMTLAECSSFCSDYHYFGTEYATQCFCGDSLSGSSTEAADTDCNMPCGGNITETCGGSNMLSVYINNQYVTPGGAAIPGYRYLGCYNDTTAARSLSGTYTYSNDMSVEACASFCDGATYFGVEYYDECYCGDTLATDSTIQPVTDCSLHCSGNSSEFCGGSNRLDLYQISSTSVITSSNPVSSSTTPITAVSSSTTVSIPTTTSTITSTSAISTIVPPSSSSTTVPSDATSTSTSTSTTGLPTGWAYRGCYMDNIDGSRSMLTQEADDPTMTIDSCINECILLGYTVAGMEYSDQCFCDNYVRNNASLASSDSDCAMTCAGNTSEICGGPDLLSVYSNAKITVLPVPTVQTTNLPGSWVYQGCLQDNVNDTRTFPYMLTYANNNSATACLSRCQEYGFQAAGMEYGEQCFCGDTFDIGPEVQIVPDSECDILCTGDSIHYCGAGNLLSYYIWEGDTPLYEWTYASGNDAGLYEFLIGGVVVPLMTTVNINGKVTFLEKWGTGPPNSTGAYELDLFYENNFDDAWRAMHVQTDIFCSAGLVLPDKAGRQLNVGGWSGVSTEGIRLYWPDGSPGQTSVNDWEENAAELSLQDGRWYPSGMIMANGSILIVGGETGSNGPPVPTIEILPKVGPTLYMDWLQRTDPNNLYPYIGVMPSKSILAAYYNEARLLDEVTFETIRTLPNMPGAVNNDLGGRTYPLEGTMVFFPQSAPYTDPVKVLICGGSTNYGGDAIDNCVSIQPDVPGQNWTIERMPSKRVMTCISPLPDGTFLILNGAHQGVAGFGLATDPNFNAVLYDPTKPVNQRMTVMANTTIARLYHSEAILLPDGRVLVSGSDPEDGVNPEEYRVEVFIPPYLLSGASRPAFDITETDWAYGGTYTITITAGNVANLNVSLIGLISSTHGNSFGHRTFFPSFTCNGSQCTITAPPNPWISPPGWFHLFILDGPTPSNSSFVRIGGDPGELGNWPNFTDFTIPGV